MQRREFLAAPAALAGLALPSSFPAEKPAKSADNGRRFRTVHMLWMPDLFDRDGNLVARAEYKARWAALRPPRHTLDLPEPFPGASDDREIDEPLMTRREAFQAAARHNATLMPDGGHNQHWLCVAEVTRLRSRKRSFSSLSLEADGAGAESRHIDYRALLVRPTAAEIVRYAGRP